MSEYHNPWLQLAAQRKPATPSQPKRVSLEPRKSNVIIWSTAQSRAFQEQQAKKAKRPI